MPRFVKTDAIVLRKYDFSETSQVLAVLTRDLGRTQLLAKGIRRIRKRPLVYLDLLDHAEMVLIPKPAGRLATLTEYRVLDDHRGLRRDLERLGHAFYATELVLLASQEQQRVEPVFGLHLAVLESLSCAPRDALPAVMLSFEIRFLRRIGFGLELERCVACRRALRALRAPRFSPRRGGLLCGDCRHEDPEALEAPPTLFPMLLNLGGGSWEAAIRCRVPRGLFREARDLLLRYHQHLFERALRSSRFSAGGAFPRLRPRS